MGARKESINKTESTYRKRRIAAKRLFKRIVPHYRYVPNRKWLQIKQVSSSSTPVDVPQPLDDFLKELPIKEMEIAESSAIVASKDPSAEESRSSSERAIQQSLKIDFVAENVQKFGKDLEAVVVKLSSDRAKVHASFTCASEVEKKKRAPRRNLRPEQTVKLENAFEKKHWLSSAEKIQLALSCDLEVEQVANWFAYRRSKLKDQSEQPTRPLPGEQPRKPFSTSRNSGVARPVKVNSAKQSQKGQSEERRKIVKGDRPVVVVRRNAVSKLRLA